jgi:hypothetical protein
MRLEASLVGHLSSPTGPKVDRQRSLGAGGLGRGETTSAAADAEPELDFLIGDGPGIAISLTSEQDDAGTIAQGMFSG